MNNKLMTYHESNKNSSLIALVDCDSFYCNCERVFRPELRHLPVVVLSNNDGCVVSRSSQAKELGIAMGAPYFQIKNLCRSHGVHIFSSNFSLYTDLSRRVMNILKQYCAHIEIYSIDEAFIDLKGIKDPHAYICKIRKDIWTRTKVPVSIGLAPTKVLAKLACHIAKKNPQHKGTFGLTEASAFSSYLNQIRVEDLWSIGKARSMALRIHGIHNALAFRDFSNQLLIAKELSKVGRQVQDELRGITCFPLSLQDQKKKTIMSSRTFAHTISLKKELQESISSHTNEVAIQLRAQKSLCYEILVYIRTNPFAQECIQYSASKSLRFESPQNNSFTLIKLALRAFDFIWKPGLSYKKAAVKVKCLQDEGEHQLSLFNSNANGHSKQRELMKIMDTINLKQGRKTLVPLACGTSSPCWKMRREHKSPRYTASWNELPTCR